MEVRKDNVPCEIVSEIFLNHFTQIAPETDELIVYEGACRSGLQVRLKLRKLRELYPELRIVICFLEVDHKEALRRIAGRRAEDLKNTGKSRPEDEPVYAEKRSNTYSDLLPDIFEATHEFGPDRIIFLNYNSKTPEDGVGEILSHLCEIGALAA
jgi:adenylate kinase family enzyme